MSSVTEKETPEDWPEKRLAHARLSAGEPGSGASSPEAWRRLRNLAAAYGRGDLALLAHREFLRVERRPVPVATAPARKKSVRPRKGSVAKSEVRSAVAKVNPRIVTIVSKTPLARKEWLAKWAAASHVKLEETEPGAWLVESSTALPAEILEHPDLRWREK